jgi:hypothetical protein
VLPEMVPRRLVASWVLVLSAGCCRGCPFCLLGTRGDGTPTPKPKVNDMSVSLVPRHLHLSRMAYPHSLRYA